MIIIANPAKNIIEYINSGKNIYIQTIYNCDKCGYKGKLYRHGFYSRCIFFDNKCFNIFIPRVICPVCHKTHALIPDFLIPYFIYPLDIVISSLELSYINGYGPKDSCSSIKRQFNIHFIQPQNISYFKLRFSKVLKLVQSFFTYFKDYSYSMDDISSKAIIQKIINFIKDKIKFNLLYFQYMNLYFLQMPIT